MLDETISDLEITNEKCQQLTAELESKNSELEKLRVFKFMVRQSELREETLTSKVIMKQYSGERVINTLSSA